MGYSGPPGTSLDELRDPAYEERDPLLSFALTYLISRVDEEHRKIHDTGRYLEIDAHRNAHMDLASSLHFIRQSYYANNFGGVQYYIDSARRDYRRLQKTQISVLRWWGLRRKTGKDYPRRCPPVNPKIPDMLDALGFMVKELLEE